MKYLTTHSCQWVAVSRLALLSLCWNYYCSHIFSFEKGMARSVIEGALQLGSLKTV